MGILEEKLGSVARFFNPELGGRKADVAIYELDPKTDNESEAKILRFQYFPETMTDTKQVNWQPKEIPGASLPLYSWNSSGERTLSFTAIFSCDVDYKVFDPVGAQGLRDTLKATGKDDRNVDIRSVVAWLRRFLHPTYDTSSSGPGTPFTYAPSKLRLFIPNSGIGLAGGLIGNLQDSVTCIMTACEIAWQAFFPSGLPRLISVNLSFAQVAQLGGKVSFPGVTQDWNKVVYNAEDFGISADIFQYNLRPINK